MEREEGIPLQTLNPSGPSRKCKDADDAAWEKLFAELTGGTEEVNKVFVISDHFGVLKNI